MYETYVFSIGMIILACDALFFIILGFYLDQVVPSSFGVAKPWNFCCKRK